MSYFLVWECELVLDGRVILVWNGFLVERGLTGRRGVLLGFELGCSIISLSTFLFGHQYVIDFT